MAPFLGDELVRSRGVYLGQVDSFVGQVLAGEDPVSQDKIVGTYLANG